MKAAFLLALVIWSSATCAGKIYWQYGLGEVTSGYDFKSDRTEILKLNLAAEGPDNLKEEAYLYCRECVKDALTKAGSAAYATPGEASIKLASAWHVWTYSFTKCMSGRAFAKTLVSEFKLGILQTRYTVPGLRIKYVDGQFNANMYTLVYNELDRKLPRGDAADLIRKAVSLQVKFEHAASVKIDFTVPHAVSGAMLGLPKATADESARALAGLAAKIKNNVSAKKIAQVVPIVLQVTQGAFKQIASATNSFRDMVSIVHRLPEGGPIAELGKGLGGAGTAMSDYAKGTLPSADCLKDPIQCKREQIDQCGHGDLARCASIFRLP
jgi:hypothetical protein